MPSPPDWQRLIEGLRTGDDAVVAEFCKIYGGAIERVASKQMVSGLKRRIGPDDVAQSVYRTFLQRARGGQYQLEDAESLWRLLCAITLNKVREKARYHLRQKRGLDREVLVDAGPDDIAPAPTLAAAQASPEEAVEFADLLENLISALDVEERRVVDLRLQEKTNWEIAEELGCSERTVRRLMARLKNRFERVLEGNAPG